MKLRGNEALRGSGHSVTGISGERMLDDFKRKAIPFLQFSPRNDFEWLFLMQHHGVPTRLLDWTTNALVALYFAISSLREIPPSSEQEDVENDGELNEFDRNCAAVFAMNPNKVNEAMHVDIKSVVDVAADFDYWKPYSRPMNFPTSDFDTYSPLCITASQISPRIRAQSGLFSIHGRDVNALDYFSVVRPLLRKILIPFEAALTMQKELRQFGITEAFIYPSLESVSKDILSDEVRRYDWERKNYLEKFDAEEDAKRKSKRVKNLKPEPKRKTR
jgi:hypothetical protein